MKVSLAFGTASVNSLYSPYRIYMLILMLTWYRLSADVFPKYKSGNIGVHG